MTNHTGKTDEIKFCEHLYARIAEGPEECGKARPCPEHDVARETAAGTGGTLTTSQGPGRPDEVDVVVEAIAGKHSTTVARRLRSWLGAWLRRLHWEAGCDCPEHVPIAEWPLRMLEIKADQVEHDQRLADSLEIDDLRSEVKRLKDRLETK
jgi:hypothetical protein